MLISMSGKTSINTIGSLIAKGQIKRLPAENKASDDKNATATMATTETAEAKLIQEALEGVTVSTSACCCCTCSCASRQSCWINCWETPRRPLAKSSSVNSREVSRRCSKSGI